MKLLSIVSESVKRNSDQKDFSEENQRTSRVGQAAFVSHLTQKIAKIANLVREKCMVNCFLKGHQVKVL